VEESSFGRGGKEKKEAKQRYATKTDPKKRRKGKDGGHGWTGNIMDRRDKEGGEKVRWSQQDSTA
jgi:hypothetical protein